MKSFKKNYIGKGTAHESLEIVKVTLNVEELLKHKHEFEGSKHITLEVARMQQPDKFGRTRIAYVSTLKGLLKKNKRKGFRKSGMLRSRLNSIFLVVDYTETPCRKKVVYHDELFIFYFLHHWAGDLTLEDKCKILNAKY